MKSPALSKILKRETLIVVALYIVFFVWWYLSAYSFGDDPSKYNYILGFPEWFFYSCIVGYIGISILLWICVSLFFTETDLDGEEDMNV